jgi:ABC-2 type transport system ATP-binding protein
MARIELEHVNLTFRLRRERGLGLKDFILKRLFLPSRNPIMEVRALQDINLTINQGERIAFIGHNGAGKSTMLKMLAGIYQPSSGRRLVEGRVSSLFDIALGFEVEANGWENIRARRQPACAARSKPSPSSASWVIFSICRYAIIPPA